MTRFEMHRTEDVSGQSGTGVVAVGVVLPSGRVALEWQRPPHALAMFDSLDAPLSVHGHEGRTTIHHLDPEPEAA